MNGWLGWPPNHRLERPENVKENSSWSSLVCCIADCVVILSRPFRHLSALRWCAILHLRSEKLSFCLCFSSVCPSPSFSLSLSLPLYLSLSPLSLFLFFCLVLSLLTEALCSRDFLSQGLSLSAALRPIRSKTLFFCSLSLPFSFPCSRSARNATLLSTLHSLPLSPSHFSLKMLRAVGRQQPRLLSLAPSLAFPPKVHSRALSALCAPAISARERRVCAHVPQKRTFDRLVGAALEAGDTPQSKDIAITHPDGKVRG